MEPGFIKSTSENLPNVDIDMVHEFYITNPNFVSAEFRNVKTKRSTKESYGDNAVGYVQLKREGTKCVVKGQITPEHRIHGKSYNVEVIVDEKNRHILLCECKDCAAAAGGCKHGVAFLLWLHRRSEDLSVTSVSCYWKKSVMSKIGNQKMDLESLVDGKISPLQPKDPVFVQEFASCSTVTSGILLDIVKPRDRSLSLYHLMLNYKDMSQTLTYDEFLKYCMLQMHPELCASAECQTRSQSKSNEWYELRFGRITASKIYEASRCKTLSGVLIESILGAAKPFETDATLRGINLEPLVLSEVAKIKSIQIKQCGLVLNAHHPFLGASPDGVSDEYCIEIKCPTTEKTIQQYLKHNIINPKYLYQLQLQMLMCNKKKGLFCVASNNFEIDRKVKIVEVDFDSESLSDVVNCAESFWKLAIFPALSNM